MKVIVTAAFDGDRQAFAIAALERLAEVVGSRTASRATLDVRLPESELEALGPELMTQQEERAVLSLWDTDGDTARSIPYLPAADWSAYTTSRRSSEGLRPDVAVRDAITWVQDDRLSAPWCDLSDAAFSRHWRERHGPLAVARQPGFWHYVQNHLVERSPILARLGRLR